MRRFFAGGMGFALALLPGRGEVTLPALFSEHAVLQRSAATPVWGKAAPGEEVAVSLDDARAAVVAGAAGTWRVSLDLSRIGDGPFALTVQGWNRLEVADVAVGEVWLASGQSNMDFVLRGARGGGEEIARSADPGLRQFLVNKNAGANPAAECGGAWTVAGPETAGGFGAVGYYFGKSLRRELRVPVGLIHAAWGGTPVESWTSAEALASVPALGAKASQLAREGEAYDAAQAAYLAGEDAWEKKFGRVVPPPPARAPLAAPEAAGEWKPVAVPGKLAASGLPDAGVVWLRRAVALTGADIAAGFLPLDIPAPSGLETVYWNGSRVGAGGTPATPPPADHRYYVSVAGLKEGEAVLAIRLANPAGGLGLGGVPRLLTPMPGSLADGWTARTEIAFPDSPEAAREVPAPPAAPTVAWNRGATLYNGMIHPLLPYAIAGAIWYQGEHNTGRPVQYRVAFPLMIRDWRARWGRDFPFYFCQLPNFQPKQPEPGESNWADLRESQAQALSLPATGQAVLIDAGEEADIHPKDKTAAGDRLARLALAKTYGKPVACSGPVYRSAEVEGDRIRVAFAPGHGTLAAAPLPAAYAPSSLLPARIPLVRRSPDSPLQGFAICGADRRWVWAEACIEGDAVLVWSAKVPQPVAVRYAWADNPTCNLTDGSGLPAAPFRTDAFPLAAAAAAW